jgi:hypothetical protein
MPLSADQSSDPVEQFTAENLWEQCCACGGEKGVAEVAKITPVTLSIVITPLTDRVGSGSTYIHMSDPLVTSREYRLPPPKYNAFRELSTTSD